MSGTVTVWSWDVAAQALKRLAPAFENQHPGVHVKVVDIGYDNAYDKISVGLQSGSGLPDVLTVESDHMATYFSRFPKGFVDLAPAAQKYKNDFDPAKWAASSDQQGHLFSLPWDSGPVGLFYRKDVLKKAGVNPASIKTWDDYVRAGERVKAKTGKAMLIADVTNGDALFPMLLQQLGQSYFSADGKVAVDTPAAHKALGLMQAMQRKGLIDNEKGWDGLVTATKAGKAAAQPIAVWWSGTLTSEMPELKGKYGVMPLPTFGGQGAPTTNNGGSTLAIPSQSKNQQAAWAFAKFMLANKANQVSMMKKEGLFPSYLPALDDPFFHQPQPYFGGQPAYEVFASLVKKIPPINYTDDYSKASDVVNNTVASVLLNGKSVNGSLASASQQIASATGRQSAK
ncbi:MAG TPA: sugar ABC transporter substrate-binding protein [Segeticoccus sp.]|uniref:ABC transporter substrate-binding protein n=1 Tax=Segeticoccus sp. TaxID=2706531 RepID=UPI002D7FE4C9|nr:sugar ABC transporter substrate-binding protein [Segeticoccus sp.]HET8598858.1 sugar ABC transporter substrate-binding protein [Segeticoccus sp.]